MASQERGRNSQLEALAEQYQQLVVQYQAAEANGDQDTMAKLAPKIQELQKYFQ